MLPFNGVKVAAFVVLGLATLAGCGGATREENAADFREQVQQLGYEIKLLPARDEAPALVEGVGTSKDGLEGRFSYSFGPDPSRKVPRAARVGYGVWFNAGDQFYSWTGDYPPSPKPDNRQINRFYDMMIDIDNVACQIVADRDCGI
jgi:hypothetical protein